MEFGPLHAWVFDFLKQAQQATRGFNVHVAAPFNNDCR
jgi:hypothetical protein